MWIANAGAMSRRRALMIVIPVLAIACGLSVAAFGNAGAAPAPVPADGRWLGWAPRGALADSAPLRARAVRVWDEHGASTRSHHDVRLLWAGPDPIVGVVVILQGRDAHGAPRLAVFVGPRHGPLDPAGRAVDEPLRMLLDRPAPDPADTRQISVLSRSAASSAREQDGTLALALAEPGAVVHGFRSWAWETYRGRSVAAEALLVTILPDTATPANTTLEIEHDGSTVYDGPVSDRAAGDRPEGGRVGSAVVDYLPPGFEAAGPATVRRHGEATLDRRRYVSRRGSLEVLQVRRPGLTLAGLRSFTRPDAVETPANPRDGHTMRSVTTAESAGFIWLEEPGVGYIVRSTRRPIDAYDVAQSLTVITGTRAAEGAGDTTKGL